MNCVTPDCLLAMQGSPPGQLINQMPLWFALIGMLALNTVLDLMSFDIVSALLCGLLICLVVVITRDDMRQLPKFALLFGVLCAVNLMIYGMPLLTAVFSGRSAKEIHPIESTSFMNTRQLTYTVTLRTTPLFSLKEGILYNLQSAGVCSMPIVMLFGAYLGVKAHQDVQRCWRTGLRNQAVHVATSQIAGDPTWTGSTTGGSGENAGIEQRGIAQQAPQQVLLQSGSSMAGGGGHGLEAHPMYGAVSDWSPLSRNTDALRFPSSHLVEPAAAGASGRSPVSIVDRGCEADCMQAQIFLGVAQKLPDDDDIINMER